MMTVRGLLLVIAKGRAALNLPQSFKMIGQGKLGGIQYPIFIMLFLIIVGDILMRNSRFFRQNYYIGGNENAARLSGISVGGSNTHHGAAVSTITGRGSRRFAGYIWITIRETSLK